jgi:hypothetical protein
MPTTNTSGMVGVAANFDLMTTDFTTLLVGKMPMGGGPAGQMSVCQTSGMNYLDAGSNPATGLFLKKIDGTQPCGLQMPMIGMLTSSEKTCFHQWANGLTM